MTLFFIFNNEQQTKQLFNFINSKHINIKFTFEGEIDRALAFLGVCINRKENRFATSVYQKKMFIGQAMIF